MSTQQRFLLLLILVGALATYGVVLLSLLLQGGLVAPITRMLSIEQTA